MLALPQGVIANDASGSDSVVAESVTTTPWYDADKGQLTPVPLNVREDDSINRDSRWLPRPDRIRKTQNSGGTNSATSGGLFGTTITLGHLLAWAFLITLLLCIIGGIVYAIGRAELSLSNNKTSSDSNSDADALPDEATLERIKHLPPELRRTDVNLRSECERLMNEGQFDQAIILLLGHQLLLLDRAGMLRLSRGKTNGRYVRETRSHHLQCSQWLRETADAFEQSYFGRHEIPSESFTQLWRQNDRMETAIESQEAS